MSVGSAWKAFFFFFSNLKDLRCGLCLVWAKGDLHPAWAGEFVAASAASGLGLCTTSPPPVRLEAPSSDCKEVRDQSPLLLTARLDVSVWSVWKGPKCTCRHYIRQDPDELPGFPQHPFSHTPEPSSCPYLSVTLLLPAAQQGFLLSSFLLVPGSISDHPICLQSSHPPCSHNPPSSCVFSFLSEHFSWITLPTTLQLGASYSNFCPWLSFVIYLQKLQV